MEAARQVRALIISATLSGTEERQLIGSTGYALRRKSAARTRLRNCSGVLGGVSIDGARAGVAFAAAGAVAFAAFFAAWRAASRASCLAVRRRARTRGLFRCRQTAEGGERRLDARLIHALGDDD
jgi:hypothetical protein